MKRLLPENTFSLEQLNSIEKLAEDTNLTEQSASILFGRGIDTPEKVDRFFSAGEAHYISPFKMSGMREAVELITRARDEDWVVAVYGDYDADGICSITLMREALLLFGIDPVVYVPEREGGYGLRNEAIDIIFDDYNPQLIITVDCGISCKDEVARIQENGAEVIVTDHHELPEELPDCITINPKISDDYIYDNLCGTGVAFKVGVALNGTDFYKYVDIAAIATVADSVTLTGENRDIVTEGLKIMNNNPRKCYAGLLKPNEAVTASSISFVLGPKINAAGRMGHAKSAYKLMSSKDDKEIARLTAELINYNVDRQEKCDKLYASAKQKLKEKGAYKRIIMLSDENWESGFVGIVAARLADEYSRPVLLFVQNDDSLHGSARSVEEVNIYEALKACSEHIIDFGGHSQAAGIHISSDKFDALEDSLNNYMEKTYRDDVFIPTLYIDGSENGQFSEKIAKELERFEPFGVGNKRPFFSLSLSSCKANPLKQGSPHLGVRVPDGKSDSDSDSSVSGSLPDLRFKSGQKFKFNNVHELTYFSGIGNAQFLSADVKKNIIFEYSVYKSHDKEYIRGIIKDIVYDKDTIFGCDKEIDENNLLTLSKPAVECRTSRASTEEVEELIRSCEQYGTMFIAYSAETVKKFPSLDRLPTEIFNLSSRNLVSMLMVSPRYDIDLSGYRTIVFLDSFPSVRFPTLEGREVLVCDGNSLSVPSFPCSRSDLVRTYRWITSNVNGITGVSAEETSFTGSPFSKIEFLYAILVFEQLKIISFKNEGKEDDGIRINHKIKTDLEKSELFRLFSSANNAGHSASAAESVASGGK